jgi:hypothetical protein
MIRALLLISLFGCASALMAEKKISLDGNAYADLVIGAAYEDVASFDDDAGAINVIYGLKDLGPTLDDGFNQYWTQNSAGIDDESAEASDRFGTVLALGDFNGDGYADLAIGIEGENGSAANTGALQIIYGTSDGLDNAGNQVITQTTIGESEAFLDGFGAALAVGDFNSDHYDDLAISAPNRDYNDSIPDSGVVYILNGSQDGLVTTEVQQWRQGRDGLQGILKLVNVLERL